MSMIISMNLFLRKAETLCSESKFNMIYILFYFIDLKSYLKTLNLLLICVFTL